MKELKLYKKAEEQRRFSFGNYTMLELKKENIIEDNHLLPLPYGSLVNGALCPEVLPDIMENLNRVCDYAADLKNEYGKEFKSKCFMTLYEIRTTYLECLHAIATHGIDNSKITFLDCTLHILEKKLEKLGIQAKSLPQALYRMKDSINTEFYSTCLESGERVIVSKGVVLKAILDNQRLGLQYIIDSLYENDIFRGDFDYAPKEYTYTCYVLNQQQNNRVALDFETIENCDEVLNHYAYVNGLKKVPENVNRQILNNAQNFVTAQDYVADTITDLDLCKKVC